MFQYCAVFVMCCFVSVVSLLVCGLVWCCSYCVFVLCASFRVGFCLLLCVFSVVCVRIVVLVLCV